MFALIILAVGLPFLWVIPLLVAYVLDRKQLRRFSSQNALSAVTNLGYVLERCRGFRSRDLHQLHRKHAVVRLGPASLSFSSPDAIRAIYGHSTSCVKGDMYVAPSGLHASVLDVVERQQHARKRRYMSHALATRNLETWQGKITDKIERLLRQFDGMCDAVEQRSEPAQVDFRKWSNLFTVDAIADIALSHSLGCLDRGDDLIHIVGPDALPDAVPYVTSLHAGKRATSILVWLTDWYRPLQAALSLIPGFFRSQWLQGAQFDKLVRYMAVERIRRDEEGEDLDDIVGCLLRDKNGEARGLEVGEVAAEVGVLLDAGSDTTAIALTHAMYHLLRTPTVLSRLRVEVDAVLGSQSAVASYAQVKDLPYLAACLDESMRLLPPVSFGLNRKTGPQGIVVDGQYIAEGVTVAVPAYTAHRNPELFPDPECFSPERWLGPNMQKARASFIPFSAGARGCIGRNITIMEQTMLIASLVHRYEFALPHAEWTLEHEEAFNLWPGALPLRMWKRSIRH